MKLPDQEWMGYDPERGDMHGYSFAQVRNLIEEVVRDCANIAESDAVGDDPACCTNTAYRISCKILKRFDLSIDKE